MAQSASLKNFLLPKTIQSKLKQFTNSQVVLPFQFFKGIFNLKIAKKGQKAKKGRYCYAISFLQLIIHCDDVLQYIQNQRLENKNEIILSDIINEIYKKKQYKSS